MGTVMTPVFRVSYPQVFEAKLNDLNGSMEYSLEAVFDKDADLSPLKEAAEAALTKKFGSDKKKWPKAMRSPFKNQEDKAKNVDGKQILPEPYVEGGIYMNLKNKQRPQVVDPSVQPIIDAAEFYPGCYARASVTCYAYDKGGNKGVNFSLNNIQKVKDGDPLGTRTRAEDDFAPVQVEEGKSAADLFN